jgi:hypothetical protein
MNEDEITNPVEQLIGVLNSPIAQRKGWTFSAEECKIWTIELQAYLHKVNNPINNF